MSSIATWGCTSEGLEKQLVKMESLSLFDRLGGRAGIDKLLFDFYADVRQHSVIGPIFNARISDWPVHLRKIAGFWALQTGGPSEYRGGFGAAHLSLGLQPEHFDHWLGLWEFSCRRGLPAAEAGEMIEIARVLGHRLRRLTGTNASQVPGFRFGP